MRERAECDGHGTQCQVPMEGGLVPGHGRVVSRQPAALSPLGSCLAWHHALPGWPDSNN